VLGADHPTTLRTQVLLADAERLLGEHAAAQRRFGAALDGLRSQLGEEHHDTLRCMVRLGLSYLGSGAVASAAEPIETAYRLSRPAAGEEPSPGHLAARTARAELRLAQGRPSEALSESAGAEAACRERYGAAHGATLDARTVRVRALLALGRAAAAAALAPDLVEGRHRTLGGEHAGTREARRLAADATAAAARAPRAEGGASR
jgi:hypothetical protein